MAPKRRRLQAEAPSGGQISATQGVPTSDTGSSSSFNDTTRGDRGFPPRLHADNTATINFASPNTKIDNSGGNGLTHTNQPVQPAEMPMSQNSGNQANVYDSLPGITRKITACAACRKNKVLEVS